MTLARLVIAVATAMICNAAIIPFSVNAQQSTSEVPRNSPMVIKKVFPQGFTSKKAENYDPCDTYANTEAGREVATMAMNKSTNWYNRVESASKKKPKKGGDRPPDCR